MQSESDMEDFQFLDALNSRNTVSLVRQRSTGRILAGRELSEKQAELYGRIRQAGAQHIPPVREIRKEADGRYLELEDYIQGVSLSHYLETHPADPQLAVDVGAQLCEALAVLHHAGIIHRDLKPENVILTAEGQAYLIDFDISRIFKEGQARGNCSGRFPGLRKNRNITAEPCSRAGKKSRNADGSGTYRDLAMKVFSSIVFLLSFIPLWDFWLLGFFAP